MSSHGQNAMIEGYDLRGLGIWECPLVEMITSWGSMRKNALHRHEGQLELCFLSLGRRVYVDARRTCVMHGGNVWCNAPDRPHSSTGRPSGSASFFRMNLLSPQRGKIWCGLDFKAAKAAWKVLLTLDPATKPIACTGLQACYDRLFALIRSEGVPERGVALQLGFNALVASHVESAVMPPKPIMGTEKVRHLIERIEKSDPQEALSVQELVREVGVSASYFVKAFQNIVGQTPGQYILSRRLESAARRLAAGDSIKEVAAACGFDSTQHFTRAFRKYFLETPKRYYKRILSVRAEAEKNHVNT